MAAIDARNGSLPPSTRQALVVAGAEFFPGTTFLSGELLGLFGLFRPDEVYPRLPVTLPSSPISRIRLMPGKSGNVTPDAQKTERT